MPSSAEVRTGTAQKMAGRGHTFVIQNKAISHHSALHSLCLISSRLILSHHSLYFNYRHTNADLCKVLLQVIEWEPTVLFMCPCMRLRWFTTTLWKCQGTVHATLAMHTGKVQSLHQAQGSTLWRGMFLFLVLTHELPPICQHVKYWNT